MSDGETEEATGESTRLPASAKDPAATARRLLTLLDEDGPGALVIAATSLKRADLSSAFDTLDDERDRQRLFCALPVDIAGEVLEEMQPATRDSVLETTDDMRLSRILAEADADDAVYFLDHLDDERAAKLLAQMDSKLRQQLEEQYELPDETAGRIMTREIITLRSFLTAAQAIAHMQGMQEERNRVTALYVVDAEARLVGVLAFRKLVFAPARATVASLMDREVISVSLETDRENVARLMQKYHLLSIPVVDQEQRIHGAVSWDNAVEVLEAEAEEDMLAIAGTAETTEAAPSLVKRTCLRMPWLVITVIGGFINAMVIQGYGAGLATQALLIGFMPMVGAMGGNIGLQCSTVTVRGLATGAIVPGRGPASILREISIGLMLAVSMSLLCGVGSAIFGAWQGEGAYVGAIVGISLFITVSIAAALGVLVPLTCARYRIDPAIAAGPFITMLNDTSGYVIYITTVNAMLATMAPRAG